MGNLAITTNYHLILIEFSTGSAQQCLCFVAPFDLPIKMMEILNIAKSSFLSAFTHMNWSDLLPISSSQRLR